MIPPLNQPVAPLRQKAQELETAFLSQMLASAGLGASTGPFSGGVGEEQFASFLRDAQAQAAVKAGGLGLTEAIFRALGGPDGTA